MRDLSDYERSAFADKAAWLGRVTEHFVKGQEDDGDYERDPEAAEAAATEALGDLTEVAMSDLASETGLAEGEVRDAWYGGGYP